jgi:cell division protein FtsN
MLAIALVMLLWFVGGLIVALVFGAAARTARSKRDRSPGPVLHRDDESGLWVDENGEPWA